GTGTFTNAGTFTKSGGTTGTTISSLFNNTGTVNANVATLTLSGNGVHTGTFNVASGATLTFNSTTQNMNSGANIAGTGTVNFSASNVTFAAGSAYTLGAAGQTNLMSGTLTFNNASFTIPSPLNQSGGVLTGTASLTLTAPFTWTSGTVSVTGTVTANGGINLNGFGVTLTTGTLINGNNQTATMSGANSSLFFSNNAVFSNPAGSTFNLQNDNSISGSGTFKNAGTFTKSPTVGTTFVSVIFQNSGTVNATTGTLSFSGGYTQTGGLTSVNGGALTSSTPLAIQGGLLDGVDPFTPPGINAGVNNISGMVKAGLSPGILTVSGLYGQGALAAFNAEVGGTAAGSGYGQLNVTSTATLAGTLNVSLINGFTPPANKSTSFTIMTFASATGTFATTNFPSVTGLVWSVTYNPTSVVITAGPAAPTLTSISVTPNPASVAAGNTVQFAATGHFSDGTTSDLTNTAVWSSADTTIATVSNTAGTQGLATGVKAGGPINITATSGAINGSAPLTVTAATLTSITVTPNPASVAAGNSVQFTATGHFSDGTTSNLTTTVVWSSADTTIATVSNTAGSQGLATGVKAGGPINITATSGAINGSAPLTVTAATLTSITVTPNPASVAAGNSVQFTATGHFSDGTTSNLTTTVVWSSADTTIATVSNTAGSQGLATGVKAGGPINITATSGAINGSAPLTVTAVVTLTSITVTPNPASVAAGNSVQFTATGHFSDGSTSNITNTAVWSSADTTIATVSNTAGSQGLATGVKAGGPINITATSGAINGSAPLTVTAATLTSITVTPNPASVAAGNSVQFTATGHFSDGSTSNITNTAVWSSADTTIATVSNTAGSQGLATGVKAGGPINITATSGAINGSAPLTVTAVVTLTSITVTPNPASVAAGNSVQFTATGHFSDASTSNITNTAVWSSADTTIATVSNTAATQGLATGVKAGGPINITATSGAVNGSASLLVQAASLLPSATALSSSPDPSSSGQPVTFTAPVRGAAGGTPTGNVTFQDNGVAIGTSAINTSTGLATFTTSSLSVGPHPITAAYAGDPNFLSSTSNVVMQTVITSINPQPAPTFIAIAVFPNPAAVGQSISIMATVTSSATGTPTGTVTFLDSGSPIGSSPLGSSGTATFSTSTLSAGVHPLTAQYSGDANFASSQSSLLNETVGSASNAVTVQITPIPQNVASNTAVQFTATVVNGGSNPIVTWQLLSGPGSLDSTGNYTAPTSSTSATPVTISASVGNASATVTFTIAADALTTSQTPATVSAGTPLSVSVSLAGIPPASTLPFTLSCNNLPAATTCQFSNDSNTPPNSPNCPTGTITFVTGQCPNFTVKVITSGGTTAHLAPGSFRPDRPWPGQPWYPALAAMASVMALVSRRRLFLGGRTRYACCLLVMLCLSVVFLASCSVFPSAPTVTVPAAAAVTPAGSYQVVVIASPQGGSSSGFVQTQLIVPVVVN
ncbi:MAG TPA: Ig-like domain-containing protein, partial [Candidatus Acidoferrales bacterium]|nr:Ig-like domain-containing protein [Candidatus Acidoferrales bacterium]